MFSLKHEVQSRKDKLDTLHQDIVKSQEAIRVLRAEWSFINQPAHIERLARKHLGFGPMEAHQIMELEKFLVGEPPTLEGRISDTGGR